MEPSRPSSSFVYVGDPMCSWCWGFAPVLQALPERYGVPLEVVVGGLRPGPSAEPMTDAMHKMLAHHWEQVAEASGQPFDHAILERRDWRYDTLLACVAVVAVRVMAPENTLAAFCRLQRAFYAEGTDITVPGPYRELMAPYVPDVEAFMTALGSEEMLTAATDDFQWSRKHGISGFPTLLLRTGDELAMVTSGFAPDDRLFPALDRYFSSLDVPDIGTEACSVDDPSAC